MRKGRMTLGRGVTLLSSFRNLSYRGNKERKAKKILKPLMKKTPCARDEKNLEGLHRDLEKRIYKGIFLACVCSLTAERESQSICA